MSRLKIKTLPAETLQQLRSLQFGANETLMFPSDKRSVSYLFVISGLVWICVLLFFSSSFRWSTTHIVVFSLLTSGVLYLSFRGMLDLVRTRSSIFSNGLFVTPHFVFEVADGEIEHWGLDELASIDHEHKYENRRYLHTIITLYFDDSSRTIQVTGIETAESSVERISLTRKLFIEATARGDAEYLRPDIEFPVAGSKDNTRTTARKLSVRNHFIPLTAAVAFTAVIMFAAVAANEYFDDKKTWEIAAAADRASSYRSYLRTFPAGRWSGEADRRLQSIYDTAEAKYRNSLNEGYDQEAADAVISLLNYARSSNNFRVAVKFERHTEIPNDLIEQIQRDFEVKKVLPLDDTFSDEKMRNREAVLLAVIANAFRTIFPDDILEIATDCPAECATFLVKYTSSFQDSIYFGRDEKHLPEIERIWSPGLLIEWDFGISLPHEQRTYRFELESIPAETITYESLATEADATSEAGRIDKHSFYDAMVSSAFDDFNQHLVFQLGIGPPPKDTSEPENKETQAEWEGTTKSDA